MKYRILLYIAGVIVGILLSGYSLLSLLPSYLPYFPLLQGNTVFESALTVLLLTFPLVTINWFIKNRDTSQQLEYSLQQQDETLFSNSLQFLFKENDNIANSVGLKELVRLKREGRIDSERIDPITSSGLQIKKASLQKADLRAADLRAADLRAADLVGAKLQGALLVGAKLQGALLVGAKLQEADLQVAYLQEAELQIANLLEADLQGAELRGAKLQGAKLQGAKLQGANLREALLVGAKLQGANFQGADLEEAELERSLYDKKTKFPKDFDPDEHKMTEVELT